MDESVSESERKIWRKFLRRHWGAAVVFAVGAALALIGAILVYLWFAGEAQSTGLVPTVLALWTMDDLFWFILNLIFWELVIVGIPLALAVAAFYGLWYKKLPYEERQEYKRGNLFRSRSRRSDAGNWFSFLFFIAFLVLVYLDGNWDVPFSTWTFDYLVYTGLTAVLWIVVIFGIPLLIGGVWWLHREIKSEP